jgi:phage baseplate assembly protein W
MAVTRADIIIDARGKRENFSDFLDSFAITPYGNQLGRVTDAQAVNQSLKNLILTNLGERLFQPFVGSNITNSLFEINDSILAGNIDFLVRNTVENNEPRALIQDVTIIPNDEDHTFSISIVYNLINNSDPITLNFTLKRVR